MESRSLQPGVPRRRARLALAGALAASSLLGAPSGAAAAAAAAEQLEDQGYTRIIVKRVPNLSAAERADLRADAGVQLERRLSLPRTELVRAQPGELTEALAELARDPDVVYAEPDAPIHAATDDAEWGTQWGLENTGQSILGIAGLGDADVDAPEAWANGAGAGQTVVVIDSGVALSHPDLAGRLATNRGEAGARSSNGIDDDGNGYVDDFRGWDWVGAANRTGEEDNLPEDVNGHGTHVAGIVAAQRDNGIGVAGIAPSAKVLPLRVLDARGSGFLSDAAEALDYAGRAGHRLVNASLGLSVAPGDEVTMRAVGALKDAIAAHPETLYVLAAGNAAADNDQASFYPCGLPEPNIVCVAASDSNDRSASWSNHGRSSVDLHAPGAGIRSTYLGDGYTFMDGTSMAAPLVAGVAALVLGSRDGLDSGAVKQRLLDTVDVKPELAGKSLTGGRVNAAAATRPPVRVPAVAPAPAEPAPTPAASPTELRAPDPAPAPAPPAAPAPAVQAPAPGAVPQPPAAAPTTSPTVPVRTAPEPDPTASGAPVLTGLKLSGRVLRRSLTATIGLDRRADLRLELSRKTCRANSCAYKRVRTLRAAGRAGANRVTFARSGAGARLKAGGYRLSVRAVDGSRRSTARTASFSVR